MVLCLLAFIKMKRLMAHLVSHKQVTIKYLESKDIGAIVTVLVEVPGVSHRFGKAVRPWS